MEQDDRDMMDDNGEGSFAELFEKSYKQTERLKPGQKLEAKILTVTRDWVFLDSGKKGEGVLDRKELLDPDGNLTVAVGDTITAWFVGMVNNELRFTTKMGTGANAQSQLEDAWRSGIPVEGVVEKEIKGGFEIRIGGSTRAFCPYSQMSLRRVEDNTALIGQHLPFKIAEYAENGRNIVVSRREILEEERRRELDGLKESLTVGMTVTGTVTSLRDFGAFVNVGGIEGLLPVSEIGWTRVKHVSDVLSVGQQVQVVIKAMDWDAERFSFSLKDTLADPWEAAAASFPEGSYHTGTVSRLAPFGAFVTLAEGIDGLVHISKLGGGKRINHPREVVKEGETVEVKVESVDRGSRRLSLSLAAASRAADEEEQTMATFRQQATTTSTASMGSLGDLLKAKLEKK
jgi:small subunit ribosomal protein S1